MPVCRSRASTRKAPNGSDDLRGGSGSDTLRGNAGIDTLPGGVNRDILTGGDGNDRFRYEALRERGDTITDFTGGGIVGGDRIDFSAIDAIAGGSDDAFLFGGTTAVAHGVWFQMEGSMTTVLFDIDGDTATTEMAIFLDGVISLVKSDFILRV